MVLFLIFCGFLGHSGAYLKHADKSITVLAFSKACCNINHYMAAGIMQNWFLV